jgi:hypothetical protein
MKKTILFIVFFSFLVLIIPGTALFADMNLGGRIDAGVDLLAILPYLAAASQDSDSISIMPVIPLVDLGFYGQFHAGVFNTGIGIRGFSLFYVNVFWPSLYAELNLWRFTLNAQIGGGALYLFPIYLYLMAGPYFVPELSMWFKITTFNKRDEFHIGMGAITLLSPQNVNKEVFRDFSNNAVLYIALKATFPYLWKKWQE